MLARISSRNAHRDDNFMFFCSFVATGKRYRWSYISFCFMVILANDKPTSFFLLRDLNVSSHTALFFQIITVGEFGSVGVEVDTVYSVRLLSLVQGALMHRVVGILFFFALSDGARVTRINSKVGPPD